MWKWITLAAVVGVALRSAGAARQRSHLAMLRTEFPRVARLRLVSACPGLDGRLDEQTLRLLFDWMLIQFYRRTGTRSLDALMRWALDREAQARALSADVTREAVNRLPRPVIDVLESCQGRTFASVVIDEALAQSARRVGPMANGAA